MQISRDIQYRGYISRRRERGIYEQSLSCWSASLSIVTWGGSYRPLSKYTAIKQRRAAPFLVWLRYEEHFESFWHWTFECCLICLLFAFYHWIEYQVSMFQHRRICSTGIFDIHISLVDHYCFFPIYHTIPLSQKFRILQPPSNNACMYSWSGNFQTPGHFGKMSTLFYGYSALSTHKLEHGNTPPKN